MRGPRAPWRQLCARGGPWPQQVLDEFADGVAEGRHLIDIERWGPLHDLRTAVRGKRHPRAVHIDEHD
ncbi:hypothetical protein [Lapillicoccus sp.]|uniref:hypothetical protein n=1 Tax=Lapillicoccus sp. TaxID=1909287 RepID=UPI003983A993